MYTPMMLRADWVLERYLGWQTVVSEAGRAKLLTKRHGLFSRNILLVRDMNEQHAAEIALRHRFFGWAAWSFIQDFDGRDLGRWERVLPGRLREAHGAGPFGVGTYVIDLSRSASDLWGHLGPRAKRMCQKAERSGLDFFLRERPSGDDLAHFYRLFRPLARERKLQIPPSDALRSMCEAGDLCLVMCGTARSEPIAVNLIYLRGDAAFYLYGARAGRGHDGAAHYAHWRTILALKTKGLRWYDFGQIPSNDPEDGIAGFKRAFGGSYVAYGRAFVRAPFAFRVAEKVTTAGRGLFDEFCDRSPGLEEKRPAGRES